MNVVICILAGGKSSRFTEDKRLIKLGKKKIIDYAIDLALRFSDKVYISGRFNDKIDFNKAKLIKDSIEFGGPLCGVREIVNKIDANFYLFLAADMPFINTEMINIIFKNLSPQVDLYMFKCNNKVYPLPLAVSREIKYSLDTCINKSIKSLIDKHKSKLIDWNNCNNFLNINTKEDLKKASTMLGLDFDRILDNLNH